MSNLLGHGPSKARLIQIGKNKFVRKLFPESEIDRRHKEMLKLSLLYQFSSGRNFKVPHIIDCGRSENLYYYDLEYIDQSLDLYEYGKKTNPKFLAEKILEIIKDISSISLSTKEVWSTMLDKFYQLSTNDSEYNDLIFKLPKSLPFNLLGYSHGDLSFDNILVQGNTFYLIDPAWSDVENILWDIGKVVQSTLINWDGIKRTGRANGNDRAAWLTDLTNILLDKFTQQYGIDAVILSSACQLSRVARWCYPDVLIPIIKRLLNIYFEGDKHGRFNALCRII